LLCTATTQIDRSTDWRSKLHTQNRKRATISLCHEACAEDICRQRKLKNALNNDIQKS